MPLTWYLLYMRNLQLENFCKHRQWLTQNESICLNRQVITKPMFIKNAEKVENLFVIRSHKALRYTLIIDCHFWSGLSFCKEGRCLAWTYKTVIFWSAMWTSFMNLHHIYFVEKLVLHVFPLTCIQRHLQQSISDERFTSTASVTFLSCVVFLTEHSGVWSCRLSQCFKSANTCKSQCNFLCEIWYFMSASQIHEVCS